eukprot:TRINITY_DN41649_c0_g1_i1.p1 TRINITY_DN41649_c0_g1~~TRINITY_DN41649_c0_g1_i1.p1  ORF type:complete len:310 (+),score=41.96 TRINITY_DN41649_c0_g1_i1:29-958(+)
MRGCHSAQVKVALAFASGICLGYACAVYRRRRRQHVSLARGTADWFVRIVLTGGPCGGKTTCVARLAQHLSSSCELKVMVVPELVTLFCTHGASFGDLITDEKVVEFQQLLIREQIHMEDTLLSLGRLSGKPVVLLLDRGALDGAAYVSDSQWRRVLSRSGVDVNELVHSRYDAVIHLVTAALGAEESYALENNEVRFESLEGARMADQRTVDAWSACSGVHRIDNSTDFDGKFERVKEIVESLLRRNEALEWQNQRCEFFDFLSYALHVEKRACTATMSRWMAECVCEGVKTVRKIVSALSVQAETYR